MTKVISRVVCNYCDKDAELVSGIDIYPHRRDLAQLNLWHCKACDAYVGCHEGTTTPFGLLADKETREARILAHSEFDKLWLLTANRRKARTNAYLWLQSVMNMQVQPHIGRMTAAECYQVVHVLREQKPTAQSIQEWIADESHKCISA